ncbi:unnamed protein product [Strongylus vulgaris]|uniref:Uncharacterized protein n=1 Tax=Strongylus vulgaris TaxID=40348 RepID=A0A3P7JLQ8_STRVU|nr:unnamed protein product [Strongylus vulgaris]
MLILEQFGYSRMLRCSISRKIMATLSMHNGNVIASGDGVECKKPKMDEQVAGERLTIRFVKLNPNAQTPAYGSLAAAGADLHSAEDCVVPAHGEFFLCL